MYQIQSCNVVKHEVAYLFYTFCIWFSKLNFEIVYVNISLEKISGFHENSLRYKNEKNHFSHQILDLREVLSHADVKFRGIMVKDELFLQNIEKTEKCI